MIRKIAPLAFDSFGVRSMATFVEKDNLRILIDPGVALAPLRYGLEPHFLGWQRLDETWEEIKRHAEEADVLVVTHYQRARIANLFRLLCQHLIESFCMISDFSPIVCDNFNSKRALTDLLCC